MDRDRLCHAFQQVAPQLAGLYRAAADLVEQPISLSNMVIIAHCVREIHNNVADQVGRAGGTVLADRIEISPYVGTVASAWKAAYLPLEVAASVNLLEAGEAIEGIADNHIVGRSWMRIPFTVYDAVQDLVRASEKASANALRRTAMVAAGTSDLGSDPTTKLLTQTVNYFMSYVHLDRAMQRPEPPQSDVRMQFATFEAIMWSRLSGFFDIVDDLTDILGRANRTQSGYQDDSEEPQSE